MNYTELHWKRFRNDNIYRICVRVFGFNDEVLPMCIVKLRRRRAQRHVKRRCDSFKDVLSSRFPLYEIMQRSLSQ